MNFTQIIKKNGQKFSFGNPQKSTKDTIVVMLPLTGLDVLKAAPGMFPLVSMKPSVLAWIKPKAVIFGRAGWVISAV